ncbi:hypothetical protein C0992_000663 [Termitomyces sp. T32_za158]|nr:hypothetical protein C0992_000663 [Termitomyces sp. T32_za158]
MRRASSLSRRPPKPKPKLAPKSHKTVSDNPPVVAAVNDDPPVVTAALQDDPPVVVAADQDDAPVAAVRDEPSPMPALPVVLKNPAEPWNHPDELEYVRPHSWLESTLISCLLDTAFSVPPRHPSGSADPYCVVVGCSGSLTTIPKGYRLPLMFAMKFQWESLRLVLTSPQRDDEWETYKFDILHVSKLCTQFLSHARQAMANNTMDKMWRCPMFDRALTRYYRRWLVNREEFLMLFWKEFGPEEYEEDILKKDWTRFVLKGHKGFHLTKEECAEGLSYLKMTAGLEKRHDERFYWVLPTPPPSVSLDSETQKGRKSRKVTGKRKRGGEKEKDKVEEARKDEEKDKDKEEGKDNDKKEKEKEKEGILIHGLQDAQDSPARKSKLFNVKSGDNNSPNSTPPAKKARVAENRKKEKVKAASGSSLVGESESLGLSDVGSRTIVKGKEKAGTKKVQKVGEKEGSDEQEHLGRSTESEGIRHGTLVSRKSPDLRKSEVEGSRSSDDGDDGKTEGEGKGEEEEEKGEEKTEETGEEKEREKGGEEGGEQGGEKEGGEKEDKEKEKEKYAEEKEKGTSDENEDEDDMILQAEGLRYPEPQSGLMELDTQVPHEADDKKKERDEDIQNSAGASDTELQLVPPDSPVVGASDTVPPPLFVPPGAAVVTTNDSAPAPAPPSAVTASMDSASISTTTSTANSVTPYVSTSTSSTALTTNMNKNPTDPPAAITTISTPPASAPPPAQPLHPEATDASLTSHTVNANPEAIGMLSTSFAGSSDASVSVVQSASASETRDPYIPPPPPVAEDSSHGPVKEGGKSPEKKQSSWDARVSKALERAIAMKGSGAGSGSGMVAGGGGEAGVPPRAAWYVPQVPQWDAKERESGLQRANTAGATDNLGSPALPAAGRFPPPAIGSRPSTSGSSSGSGPGSRGLLVSANQPQVSPSAPSVVESSPTPTPSLQMPIPAQSNVLTTTAALSIPISTETVPVNHDTNAPLPAEPNSETSTVPMDVDPPVKPSASAPDPALPSSEADASSGPPLPLFPVQTLVPQPLSRSPLRSASPAPTSSRDRMEYQPATPLPHSRPRTRELPPLPGPSLPGGSATFEEYKLAAAAWSGSGSSDHGNDGNSHEFQTTRKHIIHEHEYEQDRDMQHNHADRRYERTAHYDGYNRHSTTPGSPPYNRYHPYPYRLPSQPRYYPFAPPYYPSTPYNDYPPYLPPSASALHHHSRSSVNGGLLSEMQSPVPPDIDPEGADVDGSPVATKIVSIVQDTMVKLADVLNTNDSVRERGFTGGRRTQKSPVASASRFRSADAGISRCDHSRAGRAEGGESLKLEDILGEIQLMKEEHRCQVNKMRSEIEGLRKKVQDLERRSTREKVTDEAIETLSTDSQATEESGVVFESSLSVDLTRDAPDISFQVNRPVPIVHEQGILHRLNTPTTVNIRDDNFPSLALREEGVRVDEIDQGKEKEKVVCPPRTGPASSTDGVPMSPSHNALPLPIKSQRKGRMFVPVDMSDGSQ